MKLVYQLLQHAIPWRPLSINHKSYKAEIRFTAKVELLKATLTNTDRNPYVQLSLPFDLSLPSLKIKTMSF